MHTHLHQRKKIHKPNFILTMRLFPFLQCMNRSHLKLLHVPLKHNVLVQIQCILLSKFNLSRIQTNRYSVRPQIKNIEPSYCTRTKISMELVLHKMPTTDFYWKRLENRPCDILSHSVFLQGLD